MKVDYFSTIFNKVIWSSISTLEIEESDKFEWESAQGAKIKGLKIWISINRLIKTIPGFFDQNFDKNFSCSEAVRKKVQLIKIMS